MLLRQSLLALLEVCWRGPIVGAEDARGTSYGREDWQCDINGAHTTALMNMETVPVSGHMDEVVTSTSSTPRLAIVTHFVRPSRTVDRCHIPTLVRDLLAHELGDPLLEDVDCARRFIKGIFVRVSGMLQQRYADRIDAVMVTSCDEASAVGGKIVPVLCEVDRVKAELRTRQGDVGIESLRTGDAYLCFDAGRTWYRDGFWALGALILDETRLRVLEARNALESCGASDFSYQCDAVFFKGSSSVQEKMRLRSSHLFSRNEKTPGTLKFEPALKNPLCGERRVFEGIATHLRVIPLWDGVGAVFNSMEEAHDAWRRLGKNTKRDLWPEICEAESPSKLESLFRGLLSPQGSRIVSAVTGEHGEAGKSYCTIRAATATFETGLVLTPTNSLPTSYTNLPSGWSTTVLHTDERGSAQRAAPTARRGPVNHRGAPYQTVILPVCVTQNHPAHVSNSNVRILTNMILAAAHSSGTHVIGIYDTHQLQPVCDSSGMSTSRDNVDRKVEMDDGLLYILAADNDMDEAQIRAIERFGGDCPKADDPSPSDFHLAYTREYARFHAFGVLLGCFEAGDWDGLGCQTVVGAQYRDLGNPGKVHKNRTYSITRSSADEVAVASAFDGAVSLEETSLCRAEGENLFHPRGVCTVHAVQGRTVEGRLIIHQARHFHAEVHWLYTAVSRATGPSNVRVIDDVHRNESNMSHRERASWVSRKVSSYIYTNVTAGRLRADDGGQHREALVQELHRSYGGRCNLCNHEPIWAVYSERQPTLDRLDCSLPHTAENVDVQCLKCNRARRSLGRGKSKRKKVDSSGKEER
ncbi:unnamed protein product [Ectocarpus sp. CCAP 1310/34]|nr:unnamed protein product [Ectocarpus sp. CCAP 1310/34]